MNRTGSREVLPAMRYKVTFFLMYQVVRSIEIDLSPTTPASSRFLTTIYSAERVQRLITSNDNRPPKLEQCFRFGGRLPHHELFGGGGFGQGQPLRKKSRFFWTRPKIYARPDIEKFIALAFLKVT
jgi:hypothetical protein